MSMTCDKCEHANPPGSRFCTRCGAAPDCESRCPACGAPVAAGRRFCTQCGARLAPGAPPAAQPPGPAAETSARPREKTNRKPLWIAAAALVLVGVGATTLWLLTRKRGLQLELGGPIAVKLPQNSSLAERNPSGTVVKNLEDLPRLPGGGEVLAAGKFEPDRLHSMEPMEATWPLAQRREPGSKLWIVTLWDDEQAWLYTGEQATVDASGTSATGRLYHFSVNAITLEQLKDISHKDLATQFLKALAAARFQDEPTLESSAAQVGRVRHASALTQNQLRADKARQIFQGRIQPMNQFWSQVRRFFGGCGQSVRSAAAVALGEKVVTVLGSKDEYLSVRREIVMRSRDIGGLSHKEMLQIPWKLKCGNCAEMVDLMTWLLAEAGVTHVRKMEQYDPQNNHVWLVVNPARDLDPDIPWTWGPHAVVPDAWLRKTFARPEDIWKHKNYFNWGSQHPGIKGLPTRKRLKHLAEKGTDTTAKCREYKELYDKYMEIPYEYRTVAQGVRFDPPGPKQLCPHDPCCFQPAWFQKGDSERIDSRFDRETEQSENFVFSAESRRLPPSSPVESMRLRIDPGILTETSDDLARSLRFFQESAEATLKAKNQPLEGSTISRWQMKRIGGNERILYRVDKFYERPARILFHGLYWHRGHYIQCEVYTREGGSYGAAQAAWQNVVSNARRVLDERFGR